jgi:hypothetical protein
LGRYARRNTARSGGKPALIVYTYNEAATIAGVARRTLERLISIGEGPAIIELSARRRGILDADLRAWLQRRRRAPPGEAPASFESAHP